MKTTRNVLMLAALVSISILMSCGGDSGQGKTDGEKLIAALTSGTWNINTGSTSVSNVTGTFDVPTFGINFTASGSTVNFTLSGDVSQYLSGGSFTVDDDASIDDEIVNAASTDLVVVSTTVGVSDAQDRVEVEVVVDENDARLGGVGTYTLVYDL